MSYKHVSPEERHYIEVEHRKGTTDKDIGKNLDRATSTISRELEG